eukprot:SAG31_NODE_6564_length_1973_cov_1.761473_1_plen_129_part_00
MYAVRSYRLVDSVREVLGEPMKLDAKEMIEDRLAWQRPGLGQEGTIHLAQFGTVGARVSIEVGSLWWTRQGQSQEGTLHLARLEGAVADGSWELTMREDWTTAAGQGATMATGPRQWRERKRLFDPGG